MGGKCLVDGRADDVDGDKEREEHDEHEGGVHDVFRDALLRTEAACGKVTQRSAE